MYFIITPAFTSSEAFLPSTTALSILRLPITNIVTDSIAPDLSHSVFVVKVNPNSPTETPLDFSTHATANSPISTISNVLLGWLIIALGRLEYKLFCWINHRTFLFLRGSSTHRKHYPQGE